MIETVLNRWACVVLLMLISTSVAAGPLLTGQPQSFIFIDKGYFADKPVTVHYYKSRSAGPDATVLFSIHGVERNGKRARENWMEFAEQNQLIILAPEFDQARFPHRLFQLGGIESSDSQKWTFALIEKMFEVVRSEEQLRTTSYLLFGHSAGAQFVHRLVLMADTPHLLAAVSANAGSYTLPVYPVSPRDPVFPWTLSDERLDTTRLGAALRRNLTVLLGENDSATDSPTLPQQPEAMTQGTSRLERGKLFYALAQSQAHRLKVSFQWQLATVPGVGHDSRAMSRAAAGLLFKSPGVQPNTAQQN